MEILIPGLILVALMVYASTKIKKASAQALEAEQVETPDYVISKPAGFINVISPDDGLLFHAYTKEFAEDAPAFRRAEATIRVFDNSDARDLYGELKRSADRVVYEKDGENDSDGSKLSIDILVDDIRVERSLKLLQKGASVYRFCFDTPAECRDQYDSAKREMIESFHLKA